MAKKILTSISLILFTFLLFATNSFALEVYGGYYKHPIVRFVEEYCFIPVFAAIGIFLAFGVSFAIMVFKRNMLNVEKEELDGELNNEYIQFSKYIDMSGTIFYALLMILNILFMLILWSEFESIFWIIVQVLICNLSFTSFLQKKTLFAYISLLVAAVIPILPFLSYL